MNPGAPMRGQRLGYSSQATDPTQHALAGVPMDRLFSESPAAVPGIKAALEELKAFARPGDTVVIAAIDDLAWNLPQLRNIVHDLTALGVDVEFVHEGVTFGNGTPAAVQHLATLNTLTEFESRLARQQQQAGIEAAKARGAYTGRRRVLTDQQAAELSRRVSEGASKTELAQELGISRETVYQYLRRVAAREAATEIDQNPAT